MPLNTKKLQLLCEILLRDVKGYNEGKIPKAQDESWAQLEESLFQLENFLTLKGVKWHNRLPTTKDVGKMFFFKFQEREHIRISIIRIRQDKDGHLYMGGETQINGWLKDAYGTRVDMFVSQRKNCWLSDEMDIPDELKNFKS